MGHSMHQVVLDEISRDASPYVRRFAMKIIAAANKQPILDVACGGGRNAMLMARLGVTVVCMDKTLDFFNANILRQHKNLGKYSRQLVSKKIDLLNNKWPFRPKSLGGIICIHFYSAMLLPYFATSLIPGSYFLLETVPGNGGNYLELPQKGDLKTLLSSAFDFDFYKEKNVGPSGQAAVVVKLLARRKM